MRPLLIGACREQSTHLACRSRLRARLRVGDGHVDHRGAGSGVSMLFGDPNILGVTVGAPHSGKLTFVGGLFHVCQVLSPAYCQCRWCLGPRDG